MLSNGLKEAAKERMIPAIIVDGELKFGKGVPTKDELRKAVLEGIR